MLQTRAAVLLDLDEVSMIEADFERLADDSYTGMLIALPAKEARLLISEDEWPLALALNDGKGWKVGSFLLRAPNEQVIDKADSLDADIFQEDRKEWEAAVREYFSLRIAKEVQPAIEDFNAKRVPLVADLITDRWGDLKGEVCIDAGCGSGAGAMAIRLAGLSPLSFDNDASSLSLGLRAGRLLPEDTIRLDGTNASKYLAHASYGIILMAGEIGPHNHMFWRKIVNEMLELTDRTLVTFGTEKEARMVEAWAKERNRKVEVLENKRDLFYDGWVCDIRRV
jgi:precorrin-6B methylase 2